VALTSNSLVDHASTTTEPGVPAPPATSRAESSTPCVESLRICRSVAASTMASRPSGSPSAYVGDPRRATSVSPARKPAFQVAVASLAAEPTPTPTRPLNEKVSPGRSSAPESRLTASANDGPTVEGTGTVKVATGSVTPSCFASFVVKAAFAGVPLTGTVRAAPSAVTPWRNAAVTPASS
jgi:hypothetical protein